MMSGFIGSLRAVPSAMDTDQTSLGAVAVARIFVPGHAGCQESMSMLILCWRLDPQHLSRRCAVH